MFCFQAKLAYKIVLFDKNFGNELFFNYLKYFLFFIFSYSINELIYSINSTINFIKILTELSWFIRLIFIIGMKAETLSPQLFLRFRNTLYQGLREPAPN